MGFVKVKNRLQLHVRIWLGLPLRHGPVPGSFAESERNYFVEFYCTSFVWTGLLAVLSFSVVDFALFPEIQWQLVGARCVGIAVACVALSLYRIKAVRERHYVWPQYLTTGYLGVLMGYLACRTGYEASIHISGVVFIVLALCTQNWNPRHLVGFMLLSMGPFWGAIAWNWPHANKALVLADFMICLGTVKLALTGYVVARRLRKANYEQRRKLENRTEEQRIVIDQKTREGIYLERLASQFSPQVIDSIKAGTLDLEARKRREVACIFVDVQNSTSRAARIDHHNYTDLIAAFFEECVKVFLKHNVTVGTYLGDGILAFTNAPTQDPEYRRNALEACLEIIELHDRKARLYMDTWRSEFNIRIGIDAGYATVGFFPSREHGTYTALGETVSLAARLCSRSDLNSIAVTKKFLTSVSIPEGKVEIGRANATGDIKGLEGELFEVFSVRPLKPVLLPASHCPSCEKPMERESRQLGASFYKCAACGFRDLVAEPAGDGAGSVTPIRKKAA